MAVSKARKDPLDLPEKSELQDPPDHRALRGPLALPAQAEPQPM